MNVCFLDRCLPRFAMLALALLAGGVPFAAVAEEAKGAPEESCIRCHSAPDFLVTQRKLYNYYQDWEASIHRQEDVTCSDCHGGNPEAPGEKQAHAGLLGESDASSAVNFSNVPATCGSCHGDVEEAYRTSAHFEHLAKGEDDKQGPSCVTCHDSMNTLTLDVTTVEAACSRCHNLESDNHPEIPEEARRALNKFLSIDRFYRYVAVRLDTEESRRFLEGIDTRRDELSVQWHSFDLERIGAATSGILDELRERRDRIRARSRAATVGSDDSAP